AEDHRASRVLVGGRVLEELQPQYVDDPGGPVGPLDVATDPEERIGDPAEHQRSSFDEGVSLGAPEPRQMTSPPSPSWGTRLYRPASTHVSLEPPPWLELTTS